MQRSASGVPQAAGREAELHIEFAEREAMLRKAALKAQVAMRSEAAEELAVLRRSMAAEREAAASAAEGDAAVALAVARAEAGRKDEVRPPRAHVSTSTPAQRAGALGWRIRPIRRVAPEMLTAKAACRVWPLLSNWRT